MSWQPYALAALAVLVFGLLFYLGQATGWDEKVLIGAGLGGGLGLGLMGLSLFGMLRALKEETKSQALGHVFGGFLLRRVKRSWESPAVCAARLLRLLALSRWQDVPGQAPWFFEENRQEWPAAADRDAPAVRQALSRYLPAQA